MFFSHYVFSRKFYTFWTACTMYVPSLLIHVSLHDPLIWHRGSVWAFMSGTFCIVLPLWESRKEMAMILRAAYRTSVGAPS
jgi:hypothetical protein